MESKSIIIDYFKAFLMTCVILGHVIIEDPNPPFTLTVILNIVYSFHIPVFFAISGYLISKSNLNNERWGDFWRKYLKRLIIPFFITLIAIKVMIAPNWESFLIGLKFAGQLWFIPTLFLFIFFLKVSYAKNFSKMQQILLYSVFSLLLLIDFLTIQSFQVYYFKTYLFPFFLIGHYWNASKLKLPKSFTIIFILTWIFRLISIFSANEMFGIPQNITSVITTLFCLNFIHNKASEVKVKSLDFFISYGRNTLPVYLYHYIFILIGLAYLNKFYYYLFALGLSAVLIVVIYLLSKLNKLAKILWLVGIKPSINYRKEKLDSPIEKEKS